MKFEVDRTKAKNNQQPRQLHEGRVRPVRNTGRTLNVRPPFTYFNEAGEKQCFSKLHSAITLQLDTPLLFNSHFLIPLLLSNGKLQGDEGKFSRNNQHKVNA